MIKGSSQYHCMWVNSKSSHATGDCQACVTLQMIHTSLDKAMVDRTPVILALTVHGGGLFHLLSLRTVYGEIV